MILVVGGTGQAGTEIVEELSRRGKTVRALVRKRSSRIELPGVEQVIGDLGQPETLPAALDGVRAALLLTPASESGPRLQKAFVRAAQEAKLPHLVKFSAYGAVATSTAVLLRQHAEIENAVIRSGLPYTFLRPAQFMQNFIGMKDSIIGQGAFYAPQGNGRINLVDTRDIAAVAAAVLTERGHEGQVYDITGPQAITYSEAAETLTQVSGRPVQYVNVPPAAFEQTLLGYGVPPFLAHGLIELYDIWRASGASEVTDVVERIGKKTPTTFKQFAEEHAAIFKG